MNYFVLLAGALYLGGALRDTLNGNYVLAGVYVAYACANFLLARLG